MQMSWCQRRSSNLTQEVIIRLFISDSQRRSAAALTGYPLIIQTTELTVICQASVKEPFLLLCVFQGHSMKELKLLSNLRWTYAR